MQFVNKRIAVLGSGLEGRDVLAWLKKNSSGCKIQVFDEIVSTDLTKFDIIFRSPGFHRLSSMIERAEKAGVEITSATKLFFALCPARIIGITGTKGKGTTTTLIGRMLTASGKKSYVAGNIGQSPLQLLPKLKSTDWVCLELSSFQLQDLNQSPHIAVILNITSEHFDVHRSTTEYRRAKMNILKHQSTNDLAVINADYPLVKSWAKATRGRLYWFSRRSPVKGSYVNKGQIYLNLSDKTRTVGKTGNLLLRGEHNWENVTAAVTASALAGASMPSIKKALFNFKGLEHRLELVRTVKGVRWYNDSFSTTPETAIAAIKAFREPMTLILGGSEKGSDYRQLGKVIIASSHLDNLILIGQMAGKIEAAIKAAGNFKGLIFRGLTRMPDIVAKAASVSASGSVVVLSPACASFGLFANYKDRGEQFKESVKKL